MPSHRSLRIAEAVREVVSSAILHEVSDPRVRSITVLRVEVSGDLHSATVFVSVMGGRNEERTAMTGLKSAAGFLQARVANRLQTRFTPVLTFRLDDSVKKSVEMSRLIDQTLAADAAAHPAPVDVDEDEDEDVDDGEDEDEEQDEDAGDAAGAGPRPDRD